MKTFFLSAVILTLCFFSCSAPSVEKKLNTWTERLCCTDNDTTLIRIDYFRVEPEQIDIVFHDTLKSTMSILLSKKIKNNSLQTLIDIKSEFPIFKNAITLGDNVPSNFKSEIWSSINISDGKYRLYIATESSCGEIIFSMKNKNISTINFLCLVAPLARSLSPQKNKKNNRW